jgi:DnaJ-class molecular chaperone
VTNPLVILPLPLSESSLHRGSVEHLTFGPKNYKVTIPPGTRVGQKVRLTGAAEYIDPRLKGQAVYLWVQPFNSSIYQLKRDIHLELPLDRNRIYYGGIERIKVGDKRFDVTIPPKIPSWKMLRLRGAAERCNGGYEGDIYLHIATQRQVESRRWGWLTDWHDPSERRISIKFKIPWFLEIEGQWIFQSAKSEISIRRWQQWKENNRW